jgi:hypothetical protein
MISIMIAGKLVRAPEQRMSKGGKPFVSATIKATAGKDATEYWNVLAFGEAAHAEIMRLGEGEFLAVQGLPKLEAKLHEGEAKLQRSVFVDTVMLHDRPHRRDTGPPSRRVRCFWGFVLRIGANRPTKVSACSRFASTRRFRCPRYRSIVILIASSARKLRGPLLLDDPSQG